eukprot:TRINITY_DN9090_c0_g1_i9.p1 TRINITY_DN9090_c0_g1~~TRINITY_DN9090_c0_g1_i9.p1  ORF type:complete len:123 (+),score=10.59 TRINITY_DN9090_c0_g1_i9:207-575(+)
MISKTKDTPPRFMKYIHEKIGVLLRHNNHFIGCVACKNRKTLFVYDSLLSYHVSDREQAMKEASRYLSNYWSVTMSFQLQLCDIQVTNSNDCGVHAVNNILSGLGHKEVYTRERMIELVLEK